MVDLSQTSSKLASSKSEHSMQIAHDVAGMRGALKAARQAGKRIAFAPTMGNLHQGHISLMETARQNADFVVSSIFVNPMQFDRPEDLAAYPRTLEADLTQLEAAKVDLLFLPEPSVLYPRGLEVQTQINVPEVTVRLEGSYRAGHFTGVATVVNKLFNIVQPDVVCFGNKDFQQLALIRKMVLDLNMPIDVIGCPTLREPSGLAMSSRNNRLNVEERAKAASIYQVISGIAKQLGTQGANYRVLERAGIKALEQAGFKVDYVEICDRATLLPAIAGETSNPVVLVAAWLGAVRLIDNI